MAYNSINFFDLQRYQLRRTISKDFNGVFKLVRDKTSSKFYTLKIILKQKIIKSNQIDAITRQKGLWNKLSHPFITSLIQTGQDSKKLYYLMEFVQGGEFWKFLRQSEALSTVSCSLYAAQVLSALEYLHKQNIVYRNLKPETMLIDTSGCIKLTDFSLAKILTDGRTYTMCGTPQYIAPEILLNKGYGKSVDFWTLGILLYEMHVGIDPFSCQDDNPLGIYHKILNSEIHFPKEFDKNAKDLIKRLLEPDLSRRYGVLVNGIADIKNHPFFENVDFKELTKKSIKMPYIPKVKDQGDDFYFEEYPDSESTTCESTPRQYVIKNHNKFINW